MKKAIIFILIFVLASNQLIFSQDSSEEKDEEKHQLLTDKFHFELGLFSLSKSIKVGADGTSSNQNIEFEDTFKFDDNESAFFFKFDWYFSKKWVVSFESFSLSTTKKEELEEDIEWQDVVFEVGIDAKAGIDIDLYRIFFGRAFSRGQQHEFGAGLGVHALDTGVFIEGEASINGSGLEFDLKFL